MQLQPLRPPMEGPPTALHLVEEINHRVVNTFAEAIASLSLAARRPGDASPQAILAEAANRLRAHADAHRALFAPSRDGGVELGSYVGRLLVPLSGAILAGRDIRLVLATEDVWMEAARGWRVGLIVTELVRNAARHGLQGRRGSIEVTLCEHRGEVICVVRDDGAAKPLGTPGRGQEIVRAIARELAGDVEWAFGPRGCQARLRVPIDPDRELD